MMNRKKSDNLTYFYQHALRLWL